DEPFEEEPPMQSTGFEDVDRMLGLLANPNAVSPPPPPREEGLERVTRTRRNDPRPRKTPSVPQRPGSPNPAPPASTPRDGHQRPQHGPAPRSRPPGRRHGPRR